MATSRDKDKPENTCAYCLYLQIPPKPRRRPPAGNCTYHKQWIDNAARTTCSDMSNHRLEDGIYQLYEEGPGRWLYVRRKEKLRPRLFLVKSSRIEG